MSSTVRLSIKAANGSVSDYSVAAQGDWTVHQLKNHLYRHYPTHPPLTSQKLIHAGRLLLDSQTVSQSLPSSDVDPVVVHLVAYERSHSSPVFGKEEEETKSMEPVSRQPSLNTVQEEESNEPEQHIQHSQEQETPGPHPQLRHRGGPHPLMTGIPPQFYMSPYGAAYANQAYANQMALWYQAYYTFRQAPPTNLEERGVDNNVDLLNRDEGGVEVEDNVPVNAAGGAAGLGMMAGGGGGGGHRRDLVDVLYMATMFGFLGLVAYLTGSLGRLMVFAGGIVFVLLNQGGWFAVRRRRQVAPVDVNPLNRPEQVAAGEGQEQQVPQEAAPPVATQPQEPQQPQDQQRQGILATLFVFVTSFFTSLVPHQRLELNN